MSKAIATPPGEPTQYTALTGAEQTVRDTEEQAWTDGADDRKATGERIWRDSELKDTDQWALSDRTMIASMTTYRQELRDMPTLAGFPNTHTRPNLV